MATRGPDVDRRLKLAWIISARSPQSYKVGNEIGQDKDRRAAFPTEASADGIAALGLDLVVDRFPGTDKGGFRDIRDRAKRTPTCMLTVPAVTIPGEDWLGRTFIVNRTTRTAARERGRHQAVLLSVLWLITKFARTKPPGGWYCSRKRRIQKKRR